ncbi:hypothetical protein FGG08_004139 [Glutinoglossum americanum]|uniref:Uncharacterized protein n=1 Tax=Glutinoglossum americanum TaxID=1670608 RepID=A0A9P8HWY7_9PEZI|nr:hypothetical protein FGG08_004139 [Glutinoglossum americanum]
MTPPNSNQDKRRRKTKPSDLPPLDPFAPATPSLPTGQVGSGPSNGSEAAPTPSRRQHQAGRYASLQLGMSSSVATKANLGARAEMETGLVKGKALRSSTKSVMAASSPAALVTAAPVSVQKGSSLAQAEVSLADKTNMSTLTVSPGRLRGDICPLGPREISTQAIEEELMEEIKDLRVGNSNLKEELANSRSEVVNLQARLTAALATSHQNTGMISLLERKEITLQTELRSQQEIAEAVSRLQEENAALKQEGMTLQPRLDALAATSNQSSEKVEQLEKSNSDLRAELARSLQLQHAVEAKTVEVQTSSQTMIREIESLKKGLADSHRQGDDKVSILTEENATLKADLAKGNQERMKQAGQIDRLNVLLDKAIRQSQECGMNEDEKAQLTDAHHEISNLKRELAIKVEEIGNLECVSAALQADLSLSFDANHTSPQVPNREASPIAKAPPFPIYVRWVTPGLAIDSPQLCEINPDTEPLISTTTITELKAIAMSRSELREGYDVTAPYRLVAEICGVTTTEPDSVTLVDLEHEGLANIFLVYRSEKPRANRDHSSWGFTATQRAIANFRTCLRALLTEVRAKGCLNSMLDVIWEITHFPPAVTAFMQLHEKGDGWDIPCAIVASCFRELIQRTVPGWALEASRQIFAQIWIRILRHHGESPQEPKLPIARSVLMTPINDNNHNWGSSPNIVTIQVSGAVQRVGVYRMDGDEDGETGERLAVLKWGRYDDVADYYFFKPSFLTDTHGPFPLYGGTLALLGAPSLTAAANRVDAFRAECPAQLWTIKHPCLTLNKDGYLSIFSPQCSLGRGIYPATWNAISGEEHLSSESAGQHLLTKLQPVIAERQKDGTWELDAWPPTHMELQAIQDRQKEERRKEEQRREEEGRKKEEQRKEVKRRKEEKRRKVEQRRQEEQHRQEEKRRKDKEEQQRQEEQHRQEDERRQGALVKAKLREMGRNCPVGYSWSKTSGGWRCSGGSHFLSDSEVNAYELNQDPSKETVRLGR